jgi:hypothetical protein
MTVVSRAHLPGREHCSVRYLLLSYLACPPNRSSSRQQWTSVAIKWIPKSLLGRHVAVSIECHVPKRSILLRSSVPIAFSVSLESRNICIALCLDLCSRLISCEGMNDSRGFRLYGRPRRIRRILEVGRRSCRRTRLVGRNRGIAWITGGFRRVTWAGRVRRNGGRVGTGR